MSSQQGSILPQDWGKNWFLVGEQNLRYNNGLKLSSIQQGSIAQSFISLIREKIAYNLNVSYFY